MIKSTSLLTVLSLAILQTAPVFAATTANPTSVRIGYFNLAMVKASYPEAAGFDALKNQAEGQLRADIDAANRQIQKMQEDKKPQDDIQKAVRDSQLAINAKQQALTQLLQSQNAIARDRIQQAVQSVAKDRGYDLIIDGEGLYAGGKLVLDNGVDCTEQIVKQLRPQVSDAGTAVDEARRAAGSRPR